MRRLSLTRVLFTFLAFQLALGMQIGDAHASMQSAPSSAPTHQSSATHETSASTGKDDVCAMHQQKAVEKHDCCKASGCQCQCGNVPLAFDLPAITTAPVATNVRPLRPLRSPVAPSDTHFRPPIAP